MLKRSLALGALMAFVITGQAWAASVYNANYESAEKIIADSNYGIRADNANGTTNAVTNVNIPEGETLEIEVHNTDNSKDYFLSATSGIAAIRGGVVNVNGNVKIDVKSIYELGSHREDENDKFTYGINTGSGNEDSKVVITGDYATITAKNINNNGYTAQGASGDGDVYFNSKNTTINAESYYGVNGVAMSNGATAYFNGEYVTINATLTDEQGCNAIGVMENLVVANSIKEFNVNVLGSGEIPVVGKDRDGTAGLFAGENDQMTINAQKLNVSVTGSSENFVDRDYTYGIKVMGAGSKLVATGATTVTVTDPVGNAYGVYGSSGADIDLADATITATSNASRAYGVRLNSSTADFGKINITSSNSANATDKEAYGIISTNSTANFTGNTIISANDYSKVGLNPTEDDVQLGDAFGVWIYDNNNNLTFSGNETAITAHSDNGSAYGVYVSESNANANKGISFTGKTVKITADSEHGAYGVRVVSGKGVSASVDTSVEVVSKTVAKGDYSYGIYANSNDNSSEIDFNGNVNVSATGHYTTGVCADGGTVKLGSTGKTVSIEATSNVGEPEHTIGVCAYGGSVESKVNIVAETLNVSATTGFEAYNGGQINVTAKTANVNGDISAKGANSVVNINYNVDGEKDYAVTFNGNSNVENDGAFNATFGKGSVWNLNKASDITNATFAAGSVLVIEGKTFDAKEGSTDYALNGVGSDSNLTVKDGAKLTVTGIKETTYNIAKGFNTLEGTKVDETTTKYWDVNDVNTLMQGVLWNNGENGLQLEVYAKPADTLSEEMNVSESTAQSLASVTEAARVAEKEGAKPDVNGTGDDKAVAFINAMSGVDSKVAGQVYEAVSKMAEAGGNSATAASIVKNVTGVTNDRLSFNCGHSAPHKGGHGVGLFEEGSGADIWVEYVHGKDKVEDMPSTAGTTSYEGQYNGIVMGVDFKKVNKFQSGIAFNYGEGDTNSVGSAARTHSDYDFWGIGYYGNIHNDDSNVIFDIGYAKTDSDVENTNATGVNFKASPETTTWTAGVKLEKLYQNENVQIVPYTGLRFMSIDPKDYSTECASTKYQMERQNVWLLPLGVSIRQEIANDNGWTVSPRVDLSYIWAFGDTDSEMEFSTLGTKTNIGYEVMDDGSILGLVGIEAHKGQWGFGVSYSYQKGDHSESKKWFIDANYSF